MPWEGAAATGKDVPGCSEQQVTPSTQEGDTGAAWALSVVFRLHCRRVAGMWQGSLLGRPGPRAREAPQCPPALHRSGVSICSASQAWGATSSQHRVAKKGPRGCFPISVESWALLHPLALPNLSVFAVLLLSPCCCFGSGCCSVPQFLMLLDMMLQVCPAAVANASLWREAGKGGGGGKRDGKLAASSEGSGKNELKPRKMQPCWRVGGEAGGAAARHWEREGQREEVLLGDRGCLWPPAGVSPGPV